MEYVPDHVFALEVREGTPVHAHMTFEPADGGTRVRFRVHGRLGGAMRLAEPLLARMLRRQFKQHVAALKRVLEAARAAA